MKVAEKFISINGEGRRAGELAVFVRFQGCNLSCGYCDTKWANAPDCPYEEETPEDLTRWIKKTGIRNVTLTGGEPLLQKEMGKLLALLLHEALRVEIETNGAVDLGSFCAISGPSEPGHAETPLRPVFTMDWKLPGSGMEYRMKPENLALLGENDTVKFVVSNASDLSRAEEIMRKYALLGRCSVYLSPVFGAIDPEDIVEWMKAQKLNDVRLQIQLHKVIWDPEKRGV